VKSRVVFLALAALVGDLTLGANATRFALGATGTKTPTTTVKTPRVVTKDGVTATSAVPTTTAAPTPPTTAAPTPPPTNVTRSIRSGPWSDTGTWDSGVPTSARGAYVNPGHLVTLDTNAGNVPGVLVGPGASLVFDPASSAALESTKNLVIEGTLRMRPIGPHVIHTIRFVGVNEAAFVGGGMNPVATDVGLWVMGAGNLDLSGSPKTAWLNASGNIASGGTSVALRAAPSGWRAGDELAIAPTQPPTAGATSWDGFDERIVSSVSGSTVTLNSPTAHAHPVVNSGWTAEIMNLTRNVRIEGTAAGRSHVFIRSSSPQTVQHTAIRYMGPRRASDDGFSEFVLGRYGLHFHMSGDGSRGSQVIGTVIRDTNTHAFVPHGSHGVTMRDDISYNTTEDAYWWDPSNATKETPNTNASHDTLIDRSVAARTRSIPEHRGYRLAGFAMSDGDRNIMRNSVAVGVQGNKNSAGFVWGEFGPGLWDFSQGNIAHNNKVNGVYNWVNGGPHHLISDFTAYYNGAYGIGHGAYFNRFRFQDSVLYGNGEGAVELMAVSGSDGQLFVPRDEQIRFERMVFDGAGISESLIRSDHHYTSGGITEIRDSVFRGAQTAVRFGGPIANAVDLVFCTIQTPQDVAFDSGTDPDNFLRLQPNASSAWRISPAGRRAIAPFATASGS
jgi:hypothetical protein